MISPFRGGSCSLPPSPPRCCTGDTGRALGQWLGPQCRYPAKCCGIICAGSGPTAVQGAQGRGKTEIKKLRVSFTAATHPTWMNHTDSGKSPKDLAETAAPEQVRDAPASPGPAPPANKIIPSPSGPRGNLHPQQGSLILTASNPANPLLLPLVFWEPSNPCTPPGSQNKPRKSFSASVLACPCCPRPNLPATPPRALFHSKYLYQNPSRGKEPNLK